jgi:hypothetical protein
MMGKPETIEIKVEILPKSSYYDAGRALAQSIGDAIEDTARHPSDNNGLRQGFVDGTAERYGPELARVLSVDRPKSSQDLNSSALIPGGIGSERPAESSAGRDLPG